MATFIGTPPSLTRAKGLATSQDGLTLYVAGSTSGAVYMCSVASAGLSYTAGNDALAATGGAQSSSSRRTAAYTSLA